MKKRLFRIASGAVLLTAGAAVSRFSGLNGAHAVSLALYIAAYLISGADVVWDALYNIVRGEVFDEAFLMTIATAGAFIVGEYPEAAGVMLFYQLGELFQSIAVGRSRRSIAALTDLRPDRACVLRGGEWIILSPEEAACGEVFRVLPGERVPLDGTVLEGTASLDTAALTGESFPRPAVPGTAVYSGSVVLDGRLILRADKAYGESAVSRILELTENASSVKSRSESFISRFAAVYTPAVVIAAVLLAVLPPLFLHGGWQTWIYRALTFLVVSCPCALVISVPLAFFGGIGGASAKGVLVKGGTYLEALAELDTVVFDKTGTLTRGTFAVREIRAFGMSEAELLRLAALAESGSSHPAAHAVREAAARTGAAAADASAVTQIRETAGRGVRALAEGREILAGSRAITEGLSLPCSLPDDGTCIFVAVDGRFAGWLLLEDEPKPEAAEALRALREAGVRRIAMLTGDTEAAARRAAEALGADGSRCVDEIRAGLLPEDKVRVTEELLRTARGKLAFIGDGINDAPVLARADIGIAMGALGTDAAIEAADVVLMHDDLSRLPLAVSLARKTCRIAKENVWFALAVKLAVLALSAFGLSSMWAAVFADVGVCVIAVCNSMRTLSRK